MQSVTDLLLMQQRMRIQVCMEEVSFTTLQWSYVQVTMVTCMLAFGLAVFLVPKSVERV